MRLGMISAANGEPSVAVAREGEWVPLRAVPGADRLGPVTTDLLAFLGAGDQVRRLAQELVSAAPNAEPSPLLGPPFRPSAFRDCSLWEQHMIDVSRGVLRLQESVAGTLSDGYERLTRRPFPRLRPRPLWYERPAPTLRLLPRNRQRPPARQLALPRQPVRNRRRPGPRPRLTLLAEHALGLTRRMAARIAA